MKALFDYLYFYRDSLNIYRLLIFLATLCSLITFTYVMMVLIRGRIKKIKLHDNRKIIVRGVCAIFATILAFGTNMVINYPTRALGFGRHHTEIPGSTGFIIGKTYPIGIMGDLGKYGRIFDHEYYRDIIEIISFIILGVCLYLCFNKKKILKAVIYATVCSVSFELFGNLAHISQFYWPTLINNLLGTLIGSMAVYTVKKLKSGEKKDTRNIILAQIPLIISAFLYTGIYMFYYTNIYLSIYPDYYEKIDADRLNVKVPKGISEYDRLDQIYLSSALSDEQCERITERLFLIDDSEIDESSKKSFSIEPRRMARRWNICTNAEGTKESYTNGNRIFYRTIPELVGGEDQIESLDKVIERFCNEMDIEETIDWRSINLKLYEMTEVEDGIYWRCDISMSFNKNENIDWFEVENDVYGGGGIYKWEEKVKDWVYSINFLEQGKNRIVTPKQAVEKLRNGEGYAKGLVALQDKQRTDISVIGFRCMLEVNGMGYYEYVYCFYIDPITTDEGIIIDRIYVPAMKSYYK